MSRFTMALTAAAAAAIAAIAVVALPALGDDSGSANRRAKEEAPDVAKFAECLRTHGLAGAPTEPQALKPWLAAKEASDRAAVKAAINACDDNLPKPQGPPGRDIEDVIACVRSHGVDAPADPAEFKQWLADQVDHSDAVRIAVSACKLAVGPNGGDPGTCGDGPADKLPAPDPGEKKKPAPADEDAAGGSV